MSSSTFVHFATPDLLYRPERTLQPCMGRQNTTEIASNLQQWLILSPCLCSQNIHVCYMYAIWPTATRRSHAWATQAALIPDGIYGQWPWSTMDYHELPWSTMVIWQWTTMVDHVLLDGTTVINRGPGPRSTMVMDHGWLWSLTVSDHGKWPYSKSVMPFNKT